MIDRVMIFAPYSLRLTDGGPSGFLAHNLLGVKGNNFILSADKCGSAETKPFRARVLRKLAMLSNEYLHFHPNHKEIRASAFSSWYAAIRHHFIHSHACSYSVIFFHDVWALFFCLDLIGKNQHVVLQPHCPELPSQEVRAQQQYTQIEYSLTLQAEKTAFELASSLVFPNKYAEYIYRELISDKHKVYYIASACSDGADVGLAPIPLDPSALSLLFIGRRNSIKGFDIVLKSFRSAREVRPDLRLFIAGSGAPEVSEGIVDLGVVLKPMQWMKSVDYTINYNRNSYFDLSLIEALSVGSPVILAATGGHQELSVIDTPGIIMSRNCESMPLRSIMISDSLVKRQRNHLAVEANIRLYRDRFAKELYQPRIEEVFRDLLSAI